MYRGSNWYGAAHIKQSIWYLNNQHHMQQQCTQLTHTHAHNTRRQQIIQPPYKIDFWLNINNLSCFCRFVASVLERYCKISSLRRILCTNMFCAGVYRMCAFVYVWSVAGMWSNIKHRCYIRLLCIYFRSTNSKIETAKSSDWFGASNPFCCCSFHKKDWMKIHQFFKKMWYAERFIFKSCCSSEHIFLSNGVPIRKLTTWRLTIWDRYCETHLGITCAF